jgi:hypothetical protein
VTHVNIQCDVCARLGPVAAPLGTNGGEVFVVVLVVVVAVCGVVELCRRIAGKVRWATRVLFSVKVHMTLDDVVGVARAVLV